MTTPRTFTKRWFGLLVVAALALSGCDALEALKDDELPGQGKKSGKKKKKKKKGKDGAVPKPKPGQTITPRVGGWVKYDTMSPTEGAGELHWAVIDEPKPSRYLIELTMSDKKQQFLTEADVTAVDLRDPDGHVFHRFRFRMKNGPIMSLPSAASGLYRHAVQQFFRLANPTFIDAAPQEDVTVKAGTFRGCYKVRGKGVVYGIKEQATHWVHPAVPLPGVVKTEAKAGTMELVAYDNLGAKSGF